MDTLDITVGERIFLYLPDGVACSAQVSAVHDTGISVEAPSVAEESIPLVDDEFDLQWFRSRGRIEVVVAFTGFHLHEGRQFWELDIVTDPVVTQQRRYVRSQGGQAVNVARDGGEFLTGLMVDIAECSARVRFSGPSPALDEVVAVTFPVDDDMVTTTGVVTRTSPGTTMGVDVVLMLDVTPQQADVLRRYIFARQRRELRTAGL